MVANDSVLVKYSDIWNKIKRADKQETSCKPIYDYKYVKTKVRSFNGVVHTNFRIEKIPKESTLYICLTIITVEQVSKMDKKYYLKYIQNNANMLQKRKR